jgi:hypothetical protein
MHLKSDFIIKFIMMIMKKLESLLLLILLSKYVLGQGGSYEEPTFFIKET